MNLIATQLKQIALLCDLLSEFESNENIYRDNPEDATVINSEIEIKTRETGRVLGYIVMGNYSNYCFEPKMKMRREK